MYDFDTVHSRLGVDSSKWEAAIKDGCPTGAMPFTVADMEFKTAPVVVEAVRQRADYGLWGYTAAGKGFEDAVIHWMETRHGWTPQREWMVYTSGVVQALYMAVQALTAPGDGILIQPPVYHPFYAAAEDTGRTVVENPLKMVDGRYEMDFDDLARKLPNANLMVLCNPHNPVGRVWSQDDVEMVARLCYEYGVPLFADEIHCDLLMPGHSHYSAGRLPGEHLKNCLISTSASKTFSLAGLGCSTTIIPSSDLRARVKAHMKTQAIHFNNTFGSVATMAAYRAGADWVDELLPYIHGNFALLQNTLEKELPSLVLSPLEGTYLAWIDFRAYRLTQEELTAFLQKEACLYVTDGRAFGHGGEEHIRVNLACPRSELEAALARLVDACKARGLA